MAINKDIYANQCKEDLALKKRIKDILFEKKTVGTAANAIFYLIQDELKKFKHGGIK